MKIIKSVLNPFQENTYTLYDDTKECIIIDPGNYHESENEQFVKFIEKKGLKPQKVLLTHGHLDHIFGLKYITEYFGIKAITHKKEIPIIKAFHTTSLKYNVPGNQPDLPDIFLEDGDIFSFGNTKLQIFHTPGHSPGSLCFYHKESKNVIVGDVLFNMSIGRTDLMEGDYDTLIRSIRTKLLTLPIDTTVYSGHGEQTKIGFEKMNNPFLI